MNRKKGNKAVRFCPALKAVLICVVTCGLGLGYVWQKQQINSLGQQIKENEIKLEELRRENKRRGDNLAYLMSPQELDTRMRQLNLDLMVPRPEHIMVLQEQRESAPQTSSTGTEPIRTARR